MGERPQREAGLRQVARTPRTGKPSPRDAGILPIFPHGKALQGTGAGSQEGQWSPEVPGVTNRGGAPGGEPPHTVGQAGKGLKHVPRGTSGAAQVVAQVAAPHRGGCVALGV